MRLPRVAQHSSEPKLSASMLGGSPCFDTIWEPGSRMCTFPRREKLTRNLETHCTSLGFPLVLDGGLISRQTCSICFLCFRSQTNPGFCRDHNQGPREYVACRSIKTLVKGSHSMLYRLKSAVRCGHKLLDKIWLGSQDRRLDIETYRS